MPMINVTGLSHLGKRVRFARRMNGMSQRILGLHVDVTNSSISAYELGKTYPPIERCYAMALALGITIEWVLEGQGDMDFEYQTRQEYNDALSEEELELMGVA